MDIRIITLKKEQATLWDKPIISFEYILIDWHTEQMLDDQRYDSIAQAERAAYQLLEPYLNQITQEK